MIRRVFSGSVLFVLSSCSTVNRQREISQAPDANAIRFNRIVIPATINKQPVRFVMDTGANYPFLLADSAQRLGLRIRPPYNAANHWMKGFTEECGLVVNGVNDRLVFPVIDLPAGPARTLQADGLLGWVCYRNAVFSIDALNLKITAYDRVPEDVKKWQRFPLLTQAEKFIFKVPLRDGGYGEVFVDTGAPDGVGLYPEFWQKWKQDHPRQPLTIFHAYLPYQNTGVVFLESSLADKISIGPLELSNVPVMETTPVANHDYLRSRRLATLGMAALRRLEVFVDGRHGYVYLRSR